jgi:hypothetical protein
VTAAGVFVELAQAPPQLRRLLGWEHYFSLGMIDGMPREGSRY